MARKPSFRKHLVSTPTRRATYFYAKYGSAVALCIIMFEYLGDMDKILKCIIIAPCLFIYWKFIAHWIALIISAFEEFHRK